MSGSSRLFLPYYQEENYMSVELSPELQSRIESAVRSGRFTTPEELVETAVRQLLGEPPKQQSRYRQLRREIEESGVPLLSEEELRAEVQSRRGPWA